MSNLSYVSSHAGNPWQTYLSQVDRVLPYLGHLAHWGETLKRPKRTLIVDVPIEMDDGTVRKLTLSSPPNVAVGTKVRVNGNQLALRS